jgi:hypothetical protein
MGKLNRDGGNKKNQTKILELKNILSEIKYMIEWAGSMAQVVECLPNKHKALS